MIGPERGRPVTDFPGNIKSMVELAQIVQDRAERVVVADQAVEDLQHLKSIRDGAIAIQAIGSFLLDSIEQDGADPYRA